MKLFNLFVLCPYWILSSDFLTALKTTTFLTRPEVIYLFEVRVSFAYGKNFALLRLSFVKFRALCDKSRNKRLCFLQINDKGKWDGC